MTRPSRGAASPRPSSRGLHPPPGRRHRGRLHGRHAPGKHRHRPGHGKLHCHHWIGNPIERLLSCVRHWKRLDMGPMSPVPELLFATRSAFDPTQSSTFGYIPCSSSYCSNLAQPSCSTNSTCQYDVQYGDNSQTEGSFVQDTLKFSSDSIPNFRFGCGHDNSGLFGKAGGLLGLGRDSVSLVPQTAQQYGKTFSYCLPSRSSNTGYLILGTGNEGGVQFTPMLTDSSLPSFYFLKLVGISLGGQKLPLSPTVFTTPGTLLDSGTVITRLPPSAYASLRDGFRRLMAQYPRAPALSILDTCYDLTGYNTVKVPTIGLLLDPGLTVNLDFTGILYVAKLSQACLAFAGNNDPSDVVIVGNVQQRRFNVVHDVANLRIGFGANGCG
ncbi:hypothetical protein HPP92_018923 [Vanilla planifolia]|uniref:Peptidase A1 domain-containing protein n=2 Tax=Vanilla planifolia TaxID=51239 RepID=A0A835QEI3_VANPL|nr:hypothetical protein HPP92_018923 [Vanilla planifolia]